MAEFKKVCADVDALEALLQPGAPAEAAAAAAPQLAEDLAPRVAKFLARALEPDPDKRLYGSAMSAKISEIAARFAAARERVEAQVAPALAQMQEQQRLAQLALQQQAAAAAAAQAAEADGARAAATREAEAAAEAARAAEARVAAVAAEATERLRLEQEARRRARDEAKALRDETERRAKADAEARGRAELADRERKEREERKRRTEALLATAKPGYASLPSAFAGSGTPPFRAGEVTEILEHTQLGLALQAAGDALVVVDWMAPWCGPCRMIAPHIEAMAARGGATVFLKVDGDKHPALVASASIRAFPSFQFLFRGRLLEVFSGADRARIEATIARHSAGIDEVLTREAVEASLRPDAPAAPPAASLSASSSIPAAVADADDDVDEGDEADDAADGDEALLADALLLSEAAEFSGAPAPAVADAAAAVRLALRRLRRQPGLAPSELSLSLSLIAKLVDNLLAHPAEPSFRAIKRSNPTFRARLGRHRRGEAVLAALGFEEEGAGAGAGAGAGGASASSSAVASAGASQALDVLVYRPWAGAYADSAAGDPRLLAARAWILARDGTGAGAGAPAPASAAVSAAKPAAAAAAPPAPAPMAVDADEEAELQAALAASLADEGAGKGGGSGGGL